MKKHIMKKQTYISPRAFALEISGKTLVSLSVMVGTESVSNELDIGFVKEENPQRAGGSLWDNEW